MSNIEQVICITKPLLSSKVVKTIIFVKSAATAKCGTKQDKKLLDVS